jgi:hypothetical protein
VDEAALLGLKRLEHVGWESDGSPIRPCDGRSMGRANAPLR